MVRDLSTDTEIAFSVRDGDKAFDDYGVSHTKEVHLIVVREDLEHFQHLHPKRDSDGVWRLPFTPPAGGTYWLYADFEDSGGRPHTIRFSKAFPGETGPLGLRPHAADLVKDPDGYTAAEKVVDVYHIQVATLRSVDGTSFHYTVLDARGKQVTFEEYLGAKGHSVLISPRGDFVHTHPFTEYEGYDPADRPIFFVRYPTGDFYRIFTQFQVAGKVLTVDFDWTDPRPPPSSAPAREGDA